VAFSAVETSLNGIGNRDAIIQKDAVIRGEIRNGRRVEVYGYVEGELGAEEAVVHHGGQVYGTLRVDAADISGVVQGKMFIRNLMTIRADGRVSGNVQYGQLAMEQGGELSAELKNVPPSLSGDMVISVNRGRSAQVTRRDLNAFDPDDKATDLSYAVTNPRSGYLVLSTAPTYPVTRFTQADLDQGIVFYVHDGGGEPSGGFDIVVTDASGGNTGSPRKVEVDIRG
jgi:cytoskeletal protein CcmA (bactofilin family)